MADDNTLWCKSAEGVGVLFTEMNPKSIWVSMIRLSKQIAQSEDDALPKPLTENPLGVKWGTTDIITH